MGRRPRRQRRPRPLLQGVASAQLRPEIRLVLREPTTTRWVNLCELPVTATCTLWQAVHAVNQRFPDRPPRGVAGDGEPWDRVRDAFTLARAFHWARRQRLVETAKQREQRGPRGD